MPPPESASPAARPVRLVDAARAGLVALAAVTYFLPWHEVRPTGTDPFADSIDPICTGFTHFRRTPAMPLLIAGLALLVVLDHKRSPTDSSIPLGLGRFGLGAALVFLVLQESRAAHAYSRIIDERLAARIFYIALAALLLGELTALARALADVFRRADDDRS
jgi:hypothetical protein